MDPPDYRWVQWRTPATLFVLCISVLGAIPGCTNPQLLATHDDIAEGRLHEAHQKLASLADDQELSSSDQRELWAQLCASERALGQPAYTLTHQRQTCARAASLGDQTSEQALSDIDGTIKAHTQSQVDASLAKGDIGGAVEAVLHYRLVAPDDDASVVSWDRQIWRDVVSRESRGTALSHDQLVSLRSRLRPERVQDQIHGMDRKAFGDWIARQVGLPAPAPKGNLAVQTDRLILALPQQMLRRAQLAPQEFAQLNNTLSVWCGCRGATDVVSVDTGLPVLLVRISSKQIESTVLVMPHG